MDAKNIFIACNRYAGRIKWVVILGNEWNYIGVGDDYNEAKVNKFISNFFEDPEIYLVVDRHNSSLIQTTNAAQLIRQLLTRNNVTICNKDFTKMILFNSIGVMKHGTRII